MEPPDRHDTPAPRETWTGVAVVALFAAVLALYALSPAELGYHANLRANDGTERTFFAFHLNPFPEFSENFHLYVVRASRIASRGWRGSLFWTDPSVPDNHAAPFQVLLGMLALATGGRPWPWAVYMALVSALSWCGLFVAARRWLPREVPTLSITLAVLVTVLVRQPHGLVELYRGGLPWSLVPWPIHLGLRMTTPAWSEPVDAIITLACATLLFDRTRARGRIVTIAALLALLAAGDSWSYTVSWATTGLTAAFLGVRLLRERRAGGAVERADVRDVLMLGAALVMVAMFQLALGHGLRGDALVRAGIGAPWRASVAGFDLGDRWFGRWLESFGVTFGVLSLVAFVRSRRPSARPFTRALAEPAVGLWLAVCLLPNLAVAGVVLGFSRVGMEAFQAHHLYFRADFCAMFALCLGVLELVRSPPEQRFIEPVSPRAWKWTLVVALAGLFVFHVEHVRGFIAGPWFDDFRLTRDAESLRAWLGRLPARGRGRVIATASPELNYLAAYWTDADLLLPVGFPYQNNQSTDAIVERTADLLRVYGTDPARWSAFNLNSHPADVFSWRASRVESARQGYTYHLFHRAVMLEGRPRPEVSPLGDAIARALVRTQASPPRHRPDVVVIDPVSRSLGRPDLTGYRREFMHGAIEAWVREDSP